MKCDYCGSQCTDKRGNCGACGAPRNEYHENKMIVAVESSNSHWWDSCVGWNINVPTTKTIHSEIMDATR